MTSHFAIGQSIDVENFGKTLRETKPVRVGGGLSANTIFYNGNDGQQRQPFTYVLSGNINVNIFNQVNLPFSFNLNNLGSSYNYPTLPNRLSIHPMYKWVTAHIGDVAMTFSPYTLNGHQFTGVGADLTPEGPFNVSIMAGRLQRKVEYDTANRFIPAAYKRMGYGAKVRYEKEDHYLGMSFLAAKDDPNSLDWAPDSLLIFPKSNVAFSWEGGLKLTDRLTISGEYGLSLLTRDVRAPREGSSITDDIFSNRTSTQAYTALRFQADYQFGKNTVGGGYERIDPDYATLGAYYFNNDYENLTLHYARPFLKDKAAIAVNWGVQRDNLDRQDEQSSKRLVGSVNLNYTPNEKLSAALSYSSFQTYMNIRSEFEFINAVTPYDNLDTLDFKQLSQNLNLNTNYNFSNSEDRKHNLNVNLSFQQAADKRGDIVARGSLSRFYNITAAYGLLLVPQAISLHAAFNSTYSHAAGSANVIMGPTVGVNARAFQKKLTAGLSASYNISRQGGTHLGEVVSVRSNMMYPIWKRHNVSAQFIWQHRVMTNRPSARSVTSALTYSYSF